MYWCDWGSQPKIELANMDGHGRRELVTRGLYWPNGLTLDDLNNRLYWVDAFLDVLEYYDLQIHKITTLLKDGILLHPFGLTSIDDQLYWTDWYNPVVYRADKKTASNANILVSGLYQPMDIHAYDRNKTLPGKALLQTQVWTIIDPYSFSVRSHLLGICVIFPSSALFFRCLICFPARR